MMSNKKVKSNQSDIPKISNLTKQIINKINNNSLKCQICNLSVNSKSEIHNCLKCFTIYHLKCTISKFELFLNAGMKNYSFDCLACKEQTQYKKHPIYNCYCGEYYKAKLKKDVNFNPSLIPHGCGLTCEYYVCKHKKCNWPCHPGPHEVCTEDSCSDTSKMQEIFQANFNIQTEKNDNILNTKTTCSINLKGKIWEVGVSCENDVDMVYCGRAMNMGGWRLKASIWANPFKVTDKETNEVVCKKYEEYLISKPELLIKLNELVGKKLACWCAPKPCHTQVIIKIMKEKGLI